MFHMSYINGTCMSFFTGWRTRIIVSGPPLGFAVICPKVNVASSFSFEKQLLLDKI